GARGGGRGGGGRDRPAGKAAAGELRAAVALDQLGHASAVVLPGGRGVEDDHRVAEQRPGLLVDRDVEEALRVGEVAGEACLVELGGDELGDGLGREGGGAGERERQGGELGQARGVLPPGGSDVHAAGAVLPHVPAEPGEHLPVGAVEVLRGEPGEQVGAALGGAFQGPVTPPPRDLGVVAGGEYLGHLEVPPHRGSGVDG